LDRGPNGNVVCGLGTDIILVGTKWEGRGECVPRKPRTKTGRPSQKGKKKVQLIGSNVIGSSKELVGVDE